jgi:hypothetical protein
MPNLYADFNPWIDVAVIAVFMAALLVAGLIENKFKSKTPAPRGASRV